MKKSVVISLHAIFWLLIGTILVVGDLTNPLVSHQVKVFRPIAHFLWAVSSFYLFYFYLFPNVLGKKKYFKFIFLSLISGIVLSAIVNVVFNFVFLKGNYNLLKESVSIVEAGIISIFFGQFGTLLRAFIDWFENQKIRIDLEQQKLKSENALLKAQLNPHFLFNTLSNIDTLIYEDPKIASKSLLKLSSLFRYMVYEIDKEKVSLNDELGYITDFIALQKLRIKNNESISYQIIGDTNNRTITPMLFIPFIENAFKHCYNKDINEAIVIKIKITDSFIRLQSENNYSRNVKSNSIKGLGLDIVKKRLELLYPNQYTLNISEGNNIFSVDLEIIEHAN